MGIATRLTNTGDLLVNAGQGGGFDEFTGAPVVDSSLVLWLDAGQTASYPGTGTTWTDLSGNGNTGTLTNGPTYDRASGGAIAFDGVNDGVNIPHNSNIDIRNQITIECFFYLNSFTPGGPNTDRITLITKSYSYYMTVNPSGKIDTYFYGTGGYYSSNSSINLNQWTHAVVTFNGSNINWYINGIIDKSLSQSGTITPLRDGDLSIGRELFENYGRGMSGKISKASLYNRALSAAEIQKNYNALAPRYGLPRISGAGTIRTTPTTVYASELDEFTGTPVVDSSLVVWLDAGQETSYPGTGTTWTDLSGNSNNGTLTNGPTYSNAGGGAITFDGVNDLVACGTFSLSYLTISTWVYKTSSATNQGICRKQDGWAVSQYNGTLQVAPATSWTFYDTGYTIPLNTWVNIVYTYSGTGVSGTQAVYINGSNIWNGSVGTGPISPNSNTVRVGFDDNNWYWGGQISNVQLYNRALSAAEVQQNYNALAPRYNLAPVNTVSIAKRETSRGVLQVAGKFDEWTGAPIVDSSLKLWLDVGQPTSYPGTGTVWTDLSGNGNTGTLTNGPTYSTVNGGSIAFDGVDDYVIVPTSSSIELPNTFTASVWVAISDLNNSHEIISKGAGLSGNGNFGWALSFYDATKTIYFDAHSLSTRYSIVASYNTTSWKNIVVMFNNGHMYLYIDGTLSASNTSNNFTIGNLTYNFTLSEPSQWQSLNGKISNVQIYNRLLTADEISTNFNALRGRYGI
jgi:hypothetical protein